MSTRVVRSMGDFISHGMDVDIECRCGHTASLDAREVYAHFTRKRWYTGLNDGFSMGSPYTRFRCSKCGQRPVHIGPHYR